MPTTYIVKTIKGDEHVTTNIKDYVEVNKEVDNSLIDGDDEDEPETTQENITIENLLKGSSFDNPFPKEGIYANVKVHYKPGNTIKITGVNAFIGRPRQSTRNIEKKGNVTSSPQQFASA